MTFIEQITFFSFHCVLFCVCVSGIEHLTYAILWLLFCLSVISDRLLCDCFIDKLPIERWQAHNKRSQIAKRNASFFYDFTSAEHTKYVHEPILNEVFDVFSIYL